MTEDTAPRKRTPRRTTQVAVETGSTESPVTSVTPTADGSIPGIPSALTRLAFVDHMTYAQPNGNWHVRLEGCMTHEDLSQLQTFIANIPEQI